MPMSARQYLTICSAHTSGGVQAVQQVPGVGPPLLQSLNAMSNLDHTHESDSTLIALSAAVALSCSSSSLGDSMHN